MNKNKIVYKYNDYINSEAYIEDESDDNSENEIEEFVNDKYKENIPYLNIKNKDDNNIENINEKYEKCFNQNNI